MLSHFVRTRRPILGVRIPLLRKTALRLLREGQTSLPLTGRSTYEELIVAGMIRDKKKGKSVTCGGCSGDCAHCRSVHAANIAEARRTRAAKG